MAPAKVDFEKAFVCVDEKRLCTFMRPCAVQRDEADLHVRDHNAARCSVETEGLDIPGISRTRSVLQGAGSGPTIFVTLVERLLGLKRYPLAEANRWGFELGRGRLTQVCWADDTRVAPGPAQLRRTTLFSRSPGCRPTELRCARGPAPTQAEPRSRWLEKWSLTWSRSAS